MTPTSIVFSKNILDDYVLDTIDMVLTRISHPVERTRKGRVWIAWFGDEPLDVYVCRTADRLWELESDLDLLALSQDEVPTAVMLGARSKSESGYKALLLLGEELAGALDGIMTEPS